MGRARKLKKQRASEPSRSAPAAGKGAKRRVPVARRWPAASAAWPLVVVLVGAACYANSFSIPFLFDDYFAIVSNPEIRDFEPISRFFTRSRGIPHFLDTLNYDFGEERVWGYHLVNVAVHLLNAVLVYLLALVTFRLPVHDGRYARQAPYLALFVALVFVAHPLQTMAVSYIVQRAESVAAFFYLSATLIFVRAQAGHSRLSSLQLTAVLVVLAFLGIVSKETVASLPAALALYYLCFFRDQKDARAWHWRSVLLLGLPVLYGIYLARHFLLPGFGDGEGGQSAWLYIPSAGLDLEGITPWRYLITQPGVLLWYLRLYFLPTQLCFDYGWPFAQALWSAGVLLPLGVLATLVAGAFAVFRKTRWPLFGIGWFFVTLAPSSSIIPIKDAAFEYRMYLPIVGLTMVLAALAGDALAAIAVRRAGGQRGGERIVLTVAAAVVVALAGWTVARNRILQDELSLARDSATKAPAHWRNHFALGSALLERGRRDEAVAPFARAVELAPQQHTPRIMLGDLYARLGRMEDAEDVLLPATDAREESVSAAAYRQLGYLYKAQGYPFAAVGMFEEAVARKPKWHSLEVQIVRLLRHAGEWHDAAVRLNDLVGTVPSYSSSLAADIGEINLLGGVESYEVGELDFARHMLAMAMQHAATFALAGHCLAVVEWKAGNRQRAVEVLEDLQRRGVADTAVAANLERLRAGEDPLIPTSTAALRSASFS